jgi:hypothetical protein
MAFETDSLGFSPDWDVPVRYIDRTHAWYDVLGTNNHYRYASFQDVPFTRLRKPLSQCKVALLTTAAPFDPTKGQQDCKAPYNAAAKFYKPYSGDTSVDHDLRVSHVGIDRRQLTDDSNCWFPLPALRRAAASGRIGSVAPRFHGVPTNRSQRHTLQIDCPDILARCREDGVDVAVLVANCPICHQSISLTARYLEEAGIPTVVMGCAKDIVESCGVPRFLFSDMPLGNAAARPYDPPSQDATLELALNVLESAIAARTTVQNPLRWNGEEQWKEHVLNAAALTPEEIERRKAEQREIKRTSHAVRDADIAERA